MGARGTPCAGAHFLLVDVVPPTIPVTELHSLDILWDGGNMPRFACLAWCVFVMRCLTSAEELLQAVLDGLAGGAGDVHALALQMIF